MVDENSEEQQALDTASDNIFNAMIIITLV